jgi:Resolvase, N terminal domain
VPLHKVVAYYRVSTERQGRSGLGLEAQQEAVRGFTKGGTIVAEVIEVESGKRNDRPKLAEALRLCRLHKAMLARVASHQSVKKPPCVHLATRSLEDRRHRPKKYDDIGHQAPI